MRRCRPVSPGADNHICLIVLRLCDTMPGMPVSPEKLQKLQEMMQRLGVHKNDLEEKFVRGSGKGGQKVNKTNNYVILISSCIFRSSENPILKVILV